MSTRVFLSYSHKDEALREELAAQLEILVANKTLETWHARKIEPGRDWRAAVHREIDEADVVLLLVSADFLASDYCRDTEVRRAIERHQAGTARVVPVVLRPCLWDEAPFGHLAPLPANGTPITRCLDRDEAWLEVARAVRAIARGDGASARVASPPVASPPPGNDPVNEAVRDFLRPDVERWLRDLEAAHAEKGALVTAGGDVAKVQTRIDEPARPGASEGDRLGGRRAVREHRCVLRRAASGLRGSCDRSRSYPCGRRRGADERRAQHRFIAEGADGAHRRLGANDVGTVARCPCRRPASRGRL